MIAHPPPNVPDDFEVDGFAVGLSCGGLLATAAAAGSFCSLSPSWLIYYAGLAGFAAGCGLASVWNSFIRLTADQEVQ